MGIKGAGRRAFSRPEQLAEHKRTRREAKLARHQRHSVKRLRHNVSLRIIPSFSSMHNDKMRKRPAIKVDPHTSLNPGESLDALMTEKLGKNFQDTVPHKLMLPTSKGKKAGIEGMWHVKKPGQVSKTETTKRYFVSLFMKARNKAYKALHYRDTKTLVEKEVLAGKLTQLTEIRGPSFSLMDWGLAKDMEFRFVDDHGDDSVACKHIENDYMATEEVAPNVVYDGEHNPATSYVFRRYFLGDEDGVKKGNYLVKVDPHFNLHCFVPIDYGLAFYNRSEAPANMNFREFVDWSLRLPLSHKAHYNIIKRGESIMDLVGGMGSTDKTRAVYMALAKMTSIGRHQLEEICMQISNPVERENLREQLWSRICVAQKLVAEAELLPEIQGCIESTQWKRTNRKPG